YQLQAPTDFIFQVHAAKTARQVVVNEAFSISTHPSLDTFETPSSRNRVVRTLIGPGNVDVDYQAEVDVSPRQFDPSAVQEFGFASLPVDTLVYLLPSRFCPADLFTDLAQQQFSQLPRGYSRAAAITEWVHGTLAYEAGSSGPHTTAADAFQQRKGVCRDF